MKLKDFYGMASFPTKDKASRATAGGERKAFDPLRRPV